MSRTSATVALSVGRVDVVQPRKHDDPVYAGFHREHLLQHLKVSIEGAPAVIPAVGARLRPPQPSPAAGSQPIGGAEDQ